jgi:CRP-like cAMP-binding protein
MLAAAADAKFVLDAPAPDVILVDFGGSAITYRIRFWVEDFSRDDLAKDSVRTRIYYEFKRRGIEIPWPIQIQYERQEPVVDKAVQGGRFAKAIAAVPVLATLPGDAHEALAAEAREWTFADGEVIVREGDPGASMFLVLSGSVVVTLGAERRQVATTPAGGYFGEMSLLTGDPRAATVSARGDCTVLEITADAFRDYVQRRPEVIDVLAAAAHARRRELDEARAAVGDRPTVTHASIAARMRQYFGLH